MEEREADKIIAFDTLFTTNQIQMLKVLFTYLPVSARGTFAIFIKWMELQYTLRFFQSSSAALRKLPPEASVSPEQFCKELMPFCSPEQKNQLLKMQKLIQSMESMQQMLEMLQMLKELFPEDSQGGGMDFLSGLAGMSGADGMPDLSGMDLSQLAGMLQFFQPDPKP